MADSRSTTGLIVRDVFHANVNLVSRHVMENAGFVPEMGRAYLSHDGRWAEFDPPTKANPYWSLFRFGA